MQENCKRYIVLNQPDHEFEIVSIFGNQNPASEYFLAKKTRTHWGRPCQNSPQNLAATMRGYSSTNVAFLGPCGVRWLAVVEGAGQKGRQEVCMGRRRRWVGAERGIWSENVKSEGRRV